ncbi:hypothetical protein ACE6H2_015302 [Prunus campanulata]
MSGIYIVGAIVGTLGLSYAFDKVVSDKKLFGGNTPATISKEWQEETEKKFQAWPRTAASPVVINPISRQNFIVKSTTK